MQALNKSAFYAAIAVLGGTIAALYQWVLDDTESASTILFITIYTIVSIRFILEWQYYKRHRAILASSQFVLLPFILLVSGSYLTYYSRFYPLFSLGLVLQSIDINIFLNLLSVTLIIPLLVVQRLFYYYHSGRWQGFVIHRKLFESRAVPLIVNLLLAIAQVFLVFTFRFANIVSALFIIGTVYHIFKYYILDPIRARSATRALDNALYNTETTYISPRSTVQIRERSRNNIPVLPRNGLRTVSTKSRNPRTVSTRSGRASKTSSKSSSKKKRSSGTTGSRGSTSRSSSNTGRKLKTQKKSKSVAEIAPGRNVNKRQLPVEITNGSSLVPEGHITKDDLKCIICFDVIRKGDQPIVLCPHCKYPAHEDEFNSWTAVSKLCARCSKPLSGAYIRSPKLKFSSADYKKKVIDKV